MPEAKIGAVSSILLLLVGLVVSFFTAILAAYLGARLVGIIHGGWEWQFMPAYFGGAAVGIIGVAVAFPMLIKRHRTLIRPFWTTLSSIPLASFLLIVISYGILLLTS